MSVIVIGKIESGKLKVLNIQCSICGNMYSVNSFNNSEICPDCYKKLKDVNL